MSDIAKYVIIFICAVLIIFLSWSMFLDVKSTIQRLPKVFKLIAVLLLIGIIVLLLVSMFGEKGDGSLFQTGSEETAEEVTEEAAAVTVTDPDTGEEYSVTVEEMKDTDEMQKESVSIRVSGGDVFVKENRVEDLDALMTALEKSDLSGTAIILIDDYALNTAYSKVYEAVRGLGIYPREETVE